MKRWWLLLALVLSLGINVGVLSTLAFRQELPDRGGQRAPATLEGLARRLHLEEAEREEFISLQRQFLGEIRRNQLKGRQAQRALWRELGSRDPDEEELRRLVEEVGRFHAERHELLARVILESRKVLNRRQLRLYRRFLTRASRRSNRRPPPGA